MKNGLVSIVIPVFNRKDELMACLVSISSQAYKEIEIIVVDDCGSDGLRQALSRDYPQARLIRNNAHYGPAFLRNQGILASEGEYILFLDSDVEFVRKDTISNMVSVLAVDSACGSAGGELAMKGGSALGALGRKIGFNARTSPLLIKNDNTGSLACGYLATCNCMAKRKVIYEIGGFDPYWEFGGEDTDFGFRIAKKGYKNILRFDTAVLHKRSPRGRSTSETYLYHRSRMRFVIKNFGLPRFLVTSALDITAAVLFYLLLPFKLGAKVLLRQRILKENFLGGLLCLKAWVWNIFNLRRTCASRRENFISEAKAREYILYRAKLCAGGSFLPKVIRWYKDCAVSLLRFLPRWIQLGLCRAYVAYKGMRLKGLVTPTAMIFYLTNRCNLKCRHCFFWQDINAAVSDLRLDEIEKIAASLRHPVYLSLTGGEPFLRPELLDICMLFIRLNRAQVIGIATNGLLQDKIIPTCRFILQNSSLRSLQIQISLDGLEATHDKIRGVPGAFMQSLSTIRALKELQEEFPRLEVNVAYTIQKDNISEVEEFIRYMLAFKVMIRFNIIRGSGFGTYCVPPEASSEIGPREEEAALIPIGLLEETFSRIEQLNRESEFKFWPEIQGEKIKLSLAMLKYKKKQIPCYAGAIDAVLYANGEVAMCELTKPVGNIRDFDYDFKKLWQEQDAQKMRKLIRGCFCIHGCNLATSLTFRPEAVLKKLSGR